MNFTAIMETAMRVLGILKMLEPVLGADSPIVGQILGIVSKVLDGVRTGKASYEVLVKELEGVLTDMEAIRARGGVTGNDFRNEVASIRARGDNIDAILASYKA